MITVGRLIEILKCYPEDIPVAAEWEGTVHFIKDKHIYEEPAKNYASESGGKNILYIYADYDDGWSSFELQDGAVYKHTVGV